MIFIWSRQRVPPLGRGVEYITVTTAEDCVAHLITQAVYDQCVTAATGRYLTVCGRMILGAALATAAESSCSLCRVGARR